MRDCIEYSTHIYTSKSSALRAARNAVGSRFVMEAPELANRFDGEILVTESMIAVEAHEGGWRWSYTFDLAEVLVRVMGMDGTPTEARYADVAQWENATTPPVVAAPLVETSLKSIAHSLPELAERVEAFRDSVKCIAASRGNEAAGDYVDREVSHLRAACAVSGVTMCDVEKALIMVEDAANSTDPSSIARVMVKAEPYGLHHRLESQLKEQAKERGLSAISCLQSAREHLQRCAV